MSYETLQDRLDRIVRSLDIERSRGYPNLKGKQQYFAEFISSELRQLSEDLAYLSLDWALHRENMRNYPDLPSSQRERIIDLLAELFQRLPGVITQHKVKKEKVKKEQTIPAPAISSGWESAALQSIKGIGPKVAENLALAGLLTLSDLLRYYPRKHLNYANRVHIKDARPGQEVTVWGTIKRVECFSSPRNPRLTILGLSVGDGTGLIKASWFYGSATRFQQERYKARFPIGAQVLLSGTVKRDKKTGKFLIEKPEVEMLGDVDTEDGKSLHVGRIVPVYPSTDGLQIKWLRRAIHTAIEHVAPQIEDPLPSTIRKENDLVALAIALQHIHFPPDEASLAAARRRLVFDDFFYLQLGLLYRRRQQEGTLLKVSIPRSHGLTEQLRGILPFSLTGAQERVLREVEQDMERDRPMNRLVQGDVGSGKTVVALLSLLIALEREQQGVLMAPTEILAEQHFRKFQQWLVPLGIRAALLLGKQTKRERSRVLGQLVSGEIDILVGTHALIQPDVQFKRLGLAIIDEQHRFGVKQRAILRDKGQSPDVLTMTATPIPRTLALTLHGDLEVSIIDELPPGRQAIATQLAQGRDRQLVWQLLRREITAGRQAYVVFPLIEESEKLDVKAAVDEWEKLRRDRFPDFQVGLLHGQMPNDEKDEVMRQFIENNVQILVSTTVIEVGVDVPNATVMVIENAERFGLAQLHQLRGRVGRGGEKSYCFLLADKLSDVGKQRLEIMCQTNDGFVIAEQDLRLRGPGEYFGTRQSGLPDLLLANLAEDTALLDLARKVSLDLIQRSPDLGDRWLAELKAAMLDRFRHNREFWGAS